MAVANILKHEHHNWIRRATEEELVNDPTWYRPAPFWPVCFVFKDASFAQHFQCIGLKGDTVTAMETCPASTAMYVEKPGVGIDNISTPPTPSSGTVSEVSISCLMEHADEPEGGSVGLR